MGWLLFILFISSAVRAQKVGDSRDFWYEGRRYLVCMLWGGDVLALDMATARPVERSFARFLRDSAIKVNGHVSSIPDFKDNTFCAWKNCGPAPVNYQPHVRLSLQKKEPGTRYAGTISGFDKLLEQHDRVVKGWEKEDRKKKSGKFIYSDEPVLRYDTLHRRIFLVTHAGIAWVAEDSLDRGAKQVLEEVPGMKLLRAASPLFHRFIFLQYEVENETNRNTYKVCRVFDTYTMALRKLPETDNLINPRFAFCPSGDYVLAFPEGQVAGTMNAMLPPALVNLREWKRIYGAVQMGGMQDDVRLYLHQQLLYAMSYAHNRLWVFDLSQNSKIIFRQEEKR